MHPSRFTRTGRWGSAILAVLMLAQWPASAQTPTHSSAKVILSDSLVASKKPAPGKKTGQIPNHLSGNQPDLQSVTGLRKYIAALHSKFKTQKLSRAEISEFTREMLREMKRETMGLDAEKPEAKEQENHEEELKETAFKGKEKTKDAAEREREAAMELFPALGARLYYLEQRAYPGNTIDENMIRRAMMLRDRLPAARIPNGPNPQGNNPFQLTPQQIGPNAKWEFIGPRNFAGGYANGRINGITYDPNDENTYYAAAASGGIWKTVDRGVNWTPLTDTQPSLGSSAVAVDPDDSNTIYAGTGDYDNGAAPPFGMLKSTDAGLTWTLLSGSAPFSGSAIHRIMVDTYNTQNIYACTSNGLWRSTDSGGTFTRVLTGSVSNVVYNAYGSRLYAAVDYDNIYSSPDGVTWGAVAGPWTGGGRFDVATSPIWNEVVYVVSGGDRKAWKFGPDTATPPVYMWRDAGAPTDKAAWGQAWYDIYLGVGYDDEVGQDLPYLGLINLFAGKSKHTDAGAGFAAVTGIHSDHHAVAVNPFYPNELIFGHDGGVSRIEGTTLFNLSSTLGVTQFYSAAYSPNDSNTVLGGTQDYGTAFSNNLTSYTNVFGGDGAGCAINQQNPAIQYASNYPLTVLSPATPVIPVGRTADGWASQQDLSFYFGVENAPFIPTATLHPGDQNVFFVGTNYLHKYSNNTGRWSTFRQKFTNAYVLSISGSPTNPQRIYVGTLDGTLWTSANGGNTFARIDTGLPGTAVTRIVPSPTNAKRIFVTVSGGGGQHVWRCDDVTVATPTWVNINGNLPDIFTNAMAVIPNTNDQQLFVGTDVGVFYSSDGGTTWTNATNPLGLPNARVSDLTYVPGTKYLQAATYGRGMWRLQVQSSGGGGGGGSNTVTVNLKLDLQYFRGAITKLPITVKFLAGTSVIKTLTTKIPAGGVITTTVDTASPFDVTITIPRFLKRRISAVPATSPANLTAHMLIGDVNGDNVVNATDLNIISGLLGQSVPTNTDQPADLDGDNKVTRLDFNLCKNAQGETGDP